MPMPTLIHGRNGYRHGCRCQTCRDAQAKYQNIWRMTGRKRRDTSKVSEHVRMLKATGMTKRQIAEAAGVSVSTIDRALGVATPGWKAIHRDTEKKLLAVRPGAPKSTGYIPADISRRKLRALVAIGWEQKALARMAGLDFRNLNEIVNHEKTRRVILRGTAERISGLYEALHMRVGPSDKARDLAHRKRWLPPLAWDDIEDMSECPSYWVTIHTSRRKVMRSA